MFTLQYKWWRNVRSLALALWFMALALRVMALALASWDMSLTVTPSLLSSTRMSPFWILSGDGGGGDKWSYRNAKLQSNCYHQLTNTQLFTDVPVAQPCQSTKGNAYYTPAPRLGAS